MTRKYMCKREHLIHRLQKLGVKTDDLTLLKTKELERLCKYHKGSG